MAEYIETLAEINRYTRRSWPTISGVESIIKNQLAADVALVRHGHWIEDGDYQICSECGEEHCWDEYRAAYCDSCGAKMDGDKDA